MESSKPRRDSGMCEMDSLSPETVLVEDTETPTAPSGDGLENQLAAVNLAASTVVSEELLGFVSDEEWHRKKSIIEFEAHEEVKKLEDHFDEFEQHRQKIEQNYGQKGIELRQGLEVAKKKMADDSQGMNESERRKESERIKEMELGIEIFERNYKKYENKVRKNRKKFEKDYKELMEMNRELFHSAPGSPEASEPHESNGDVQ